MSGSLDPAKGLTYFHRCHCCSYSPSHPKVDPTSPTIDFLKKCSLCLEAHYCNKECQTKDWKRHKALCKVNRERRAENTAAGPLHERFQRARYKWHDKNISFLVELAVIVVTEELSSTTALVVNCSYSTVDRPKHQQMRLESCRAWPLEDLYKIHPVVEQGCLEAPHPVTHRLAGLFNFRVIIVSTNIQDMQMGTWSMISSLQSKQGYRTRKSLQQILDDVNSGSLMPL
jgi:hypothetical protein